MSPNDDSRYQAILARIAARHSTRRAPTDALATALNSLNALDTLDALTAPAAMIGYTAQAWRGSHKGTAWYGALRWFRARDYHGYRQLTVLGVWAQQAAPTTTDEDHTEAHPIMLCVGGKCLAYNAPFFDVEAYHRLIARDFRLYYGDDGRPPSAPVWHAPHSAQQPLVQRAAVAEALRNAIGQLLPSDAP
jgi:hypothetical protein